MISSVVCANQGAILMMLSSDFLTASRNLLESCGGWINTGRCLHSPTGVFTHLCSFASENRIELAELCWSKSRVKNPLLSMMIRPWVISSIDHSISDSVGGVTYRQRIRGPFQSRSGSSA